MPKRLRGQAGQSHSAIAKRRYLRRKRRFQRRRIPTGMPNKKLVKLKYVSTATLNPSSTVPDYKYFSCNGMYAPEIFGGHQPLYLDQWLANYDHYIVIGSSIRVTQMPTTNVEGTPALWGIILDDETTFSYTSAAQIIESNQGRVFRQCTNALTGTNTYGSNPRLIRKFSAKKMLGDLSDKHEGSATSNPTDQMYYGLWCASPSGSSDPGQMEFMVEISYIALLKEPKFIAQS